MLGSARRALNGVPKDALGLVIDFAHKLSGDGGSEWAEKGGLFLRKEIGWNNSAPTIRSLIPLKTVSIPATTEKFVVADHFKDRVDGVTCYVGGNFESWLDTKVEEPVGVTTLQSYRISRLVGNVSIISELGGEEVVETTLSTIYALLKKQGKGQAGEFRVNEYANIFYVRDIDGILRTVSVRCYGGIWSVGVGPIDDPRTWDVGDQVFSNSKPGVSLVVINAGEPVVVVPEQPKLLNPSEVVSIPATTEKFVVADHFKDGVDGLNCYVGCNFGSWFDAKVEEPMSAVTLQGYRLLQGSPSISIIAELGGEKKVETTMSTICALLKKQGNGQAGMLLTDGHANIFYARDIDGVLCGVGVRYCRDYWFVGAFLLEHQVNIGVGAQFFSCEEPCATPIVIDAGEPVVVVPEQPKLLNPSEVVFIPATTEKFVVADHFKWDNEDGILIHRVSDAFKSWFWSKSEEPFGEVTLQAHQLLRSLVDKQIIDELGNDRKVETTTSMIHALLKNQDRGQAGPLLVDGRVNIFYVRAVDNVLCSVAIRWNSERWNIYSYSIEDSTAWNEGYRVFSCKEPYTSPIVIDAGEPVVVVPEQPKSLRLLETVSIPATTEKFVVAKHFKDGTTDGVTCSIWSYFKSWFHAKVEDPTSAVTLRCHQLPRSSPDGPIIAELGGEDKVETTMSAIWALLKRQSKGQAGMLLVNGCKNIFYVRDCSGVLRAVEVYCRDGSWHVCVYSVASPDCWCVGSQVFSREEPCVSSVVIDVGEPVVVAPEQPKSLRLLETVSIPATTEKFVVAKHFKDGTTDGATYLTGLDFKSWFFTKVEKPTSAMTLSSYQPLQSLTNDLTIIAELGGEKKVETTMSAIHVLLKKQGNGQAGPLLVNDCYNIFYVRDAVGILRGVGVRYCRDHWFVLAYSLCLINWATDCRVFSPKSEA